MERRDDVDEAKNELDKGGELLKDARDAFDDDWNEASELANDAEDYAERAVDAL